MPHFTLIMLAAGVGIPVLAAMNASLGRFVGGPAAAATSLFAVAAMVSLVVGLMTQPQAFARLGEAPRHLFLAGVLVAFYLLSVTWIAPVIGLGNAIFLVLIGQLVAASVIDHFALFGAIERSLTGTRAAGLVLMAAGVWLAQKA